MHIFFNALEWTLISRLDIAHARDVSRQSLDNSENLFGNLFHYKNMFVYAFAFFGVSLKQHEITKF